MEKFLNTKITGVGHYLPTRVIDNDYFLNKEFYDEKGEKIQKTNQEIIQKFYDIVGIKERRYVEDDLVNSDIATFAAEKAIKDWGGDRQTLDYVIVAHNFGDVKKGIHAVDIIPSISSRVKNKLGITNRKCIPYDMIFGCPGWVQGLIFAHQLIQNKQAKNILVIGSETLSRICDPHDRDRMIFADGAGAVVVSGVEDNKKYGVIAHSTLSDTGEELNHLRSSESLNPKYDKRPLMIRMTGRKIYEYVLKNVPEAIRETLDASGWDLSETNKLLIHQANEKMDEAVLSRLLKHYKDTNHNKDNFMPMTINYLGNSSVATVPTMLSMILNGEIENHKLNPGDKIIFASVGAGLSINAVTYQFPQK